MKKTYILTRNTNYSPTGPFTLGSLLSDPLNPESIIENTYPPPFISLPSLQTSFQTSVNLSSTINTSGKFGVFTKFLSQFGLGADLSYENASTSSREVEAQLLETKFFTPTLQYLEAVIQDIAVREYLEKQRFRANIYVVTGVKIASGVESGSESDGKRIKSNVALGLDGTPAGVPVNIGPEISITRTQKSHIDWGKCDDFIYAYRVKEVRYSVGRGTLVGTKDAKGDLYGIGQKIKEQTEQAKDDKSEGEVVDIEDEGPLWVTARKLRVNGEEVMDDDGELCELVIPKAALGSPA
jgi:hypothetical protein